MNLQLLPVCRTGKIRRDGTSPIAIQCCFTSDRRAVLDSGLGVPAKYWNKKRRRISDQLPIPYGVTAELNERLDDEIRKAQEIISIALKRKDDPVDFFKVHYKPEKSLESILQTIDSTEREKFLNDVNLNKDIYFQIDDYIKTKTKKVSADMPRIYRNMKDHLLAFEAFRKKPVTFDSLDINFYESFVDFLTYDYVLARRKKRMVGLKTNTVGKTIKQFKTFLKDRVKKKIIESFDMDDWIVLEVEVDAVYLSVKEIENPVKQTAALFVNMEQYEKAQASAKLASKGEQEKKKDSGNKKYENQMKKVTDLETAGKFREAYGQLPKAEEFPDYVDEINEKKEELIEKFDQTGLFANT